MPTANMRLPDPWRLEFRPERRDEQNREALGQRDGAIEPDQTTVVVLTGSGLKAAERVGALLGIGASR